MKKSLIDILINKYETQNLASVYLANYKTESDVNSWINDFKNKISSTVIHPDFIEIKRDIIEGQATKEYRVDSKEIQRFLNEINFKPTHLNKKFFFIHDAHLISTVLSNKLLKTFEEAPSYICIFLLAPNETQLLQTVVSRSIKINLPHSNEFVASSVQPTMPLHEIVSTIKKSDEQIKITKEYIESLIDLAVSKKDYKILEQTLIDLKGFQHSQEFNNSLTSALAILKK